MDPVKKQMSHLKDFQRRTVNYVFKRMFLDKNPTSRFLVADEVGLGKTLVARGVIAKAVEHHKGKVKRIDIVYVCSNAAIAQQNINRLNVMEGHTVAATRLTMLPSLVKELNSHKINFISFTPGTTFYLQGGGGIVGERVVLFHLIKRGLGLSNKGLLKVLQAGAGWDNFLKRIQSPIDLDRELNNKYIEELLKKENKELVDNLRRMCRRLRKHYGRSDLSQEESKLRYHLIGKLRTVLARICVDALEPDLVILDEFQRFKDLLVDMSAGEESEAVQLARALMTFQDEHASDQGVADVRVLLLSATPYRMLTLDREEEEDHYSDFLETLKFLFDDPRKVREIETLIKKFRSGLYGLNEKSKEEALKARTSLERKLRSVMVRTERIASTQKSDAMVEDLPITASLFKEDLEQIRHFELVSQAVKAGDTIEYWKSSPYLLNFMKDYSLKRKIKDARENPPKELLTALKKAKSSLLTKRKIDQYTPIDISNGRMRSLLEQTVDKGYWKLLWMPPSLPYMKSSGAYSSLEDASKSLIFSTWNVVPDTIASLVSYEAERKMVEKFKETPKYTELYKKRKPLLRFTVSEKGLSGMSALALLYPCVTLATAIDPLRLALELSDDGPVSYDLIWDRAYKIIVDKLQKAGVKLERTDERGDKRWHWAALAILDAHYFPEARRWSGRQDGLHRILGWSVDKEDGGGFSKHVEHFIEDISPRDLGTMPYDVVDVLVELALAGPGVCALRSLSRKTPGCRMDDFQMLSGAGRIADGFRSLYNIPGTIGLLRGDEDGFPYWRQVLKHGIGGNLQSVMDEYVHILYESLGLTGHEHDYPKIFRDLSDEIYQALSVRTSRVDIDVFQFKNRGKAFDIKRMGMRCRFALRFGDIQGDQGEKLARAGAVRQSFNSPFRPFVLASTSVGQEGLDFHQYCHIVYHWNLPSNPVDMEQREGRVHRYKGHAVRKNVARKYGLSALRGKYRGKGDPWDLLFKRALADREKGMNDLIPYWIFEVENGAKIERRVPIYPLSREELQYKHLKKSLALYRLVFGQPRQQDLLAHLDRRVDEEDFDLDEWKISLEPPR